MLIPFRSVLYKGGARLIAGAGYVQAFTAVVVASEPPPPPVFASTKIRNSQVPLVIKRSNIRYCPPFRA